RPTGRVVAIALAPLPWLPRCDAWPISIGVRHFSLDKPTPIPGHRHRRLVVDWRLPESDRVPPRLFATTYRETRFGLSIFADRLPMRSRCTAMTIVVGWREDAAARVGGIGDGCQQTLHLG